MRLNELGRVIDSVTTSRSTFWINGEQSMILAVQKQPGTNTIAVVEGIKAVLPSLKQSIPAGIEHRELNLTLRRIFATPYRDVKFTLLLTICLVVLVIFFFLRNVSATLIPSLAVPLSLLGTFGAMKLLGFTIDTLSMMAMTLSVGFVVDDAIVMLENIVRHMEMGKTRLQAAYEGAREVGFTIISMTTSLVAVFIPVLFLEGIIGRLLREFSITIAVSILISGVISLTLTPMLCSIWLRPTGRVQRSEHRRWRAQPGHAASTNGRKRFFDWLNNSYRRTLDVVLRHRGITLAASLVLTVATVVSVYRNAQGLHADGGYRHGCLEAPKPRRILPMKRWCGCRNR